MIGKITDSRGGIKNSRRGITNSRGGTENNKEGITHSNAENVCMQEIPCNAKGGSTVVDRDRSEIKTECKTRRQKQSETQI